VRLRKFMRPLPGLLRLC